MSSVPSPSNKIDALSSRILSGKEIITEVDLSNCTLASFPLDLLWPIRETVEVINLGGNDIAILPDEIRSFHKLRILFFAGNKFAEVPEVLGSLSSLYMLSFKSNQVQEVPHNSLSPSLGWLILTDNKIKQLPASIGSLVHLRKCMLAANELTALPAEMANCREIELLRIAANKLPDLPHWLLQLPKLSWLAFAGNPFCTLSGSESAGQSDGVPEIKYCDLDMGEKLGEGASGIVFKSLLKSATSDPESSSFTSSTVAVKIFRSGATSDGLPEDEMKAMVTAGSHANCASVLGRLVDAPNGELGLVLPLIPPSFVILGGPPSFQSITRDTFPTTRLSSFSLVSVIRILKGILSVCAHLHSKHIMHGDLYAHNILVDWSTCTPVLSDFGAASPLIGLDATSARCLEGIEMRAFGCLMEDLLDRVDGAEDDLSRAGLARAALRSMQHQCFLPDAPLRPSFLELLARISELPPLSGEL